MITAQALVHSTKSAKLLAHNSGIEQPLCLQIGGSSTIDMSEAVKVANSNGLYDINLNCGCPSPKVSSGCFGAVLMKSPQIVGELCKTIIDASPINSLVSVKCRIGVDGCDSVDLKDFVSIVHQVSGVKNFIIHARKAILNKNMRPKSNLTIPPLCYDRVYQLISQTRHLGLDIDINGGISSYEEIDEHLTNGVNGVMVGRSIYQDPYYWSLVNSRVYKLKNHETRNRRQILLDYSAYVDTIANESNISSVWKPLENLFFGCRGRHLFTGWMTDIRCNKRLPTTDVMQQAIELFGGGDLPLDEPADEYVERIDKKLMT